jgi:hypothetical protein
VVPVLSVFGGRVESVLAGGYSKNSPMIVGLAWMQITRERAGPWLVNWC